MSISFETGKKHEPERFGVAKQGPHEATRSQPVRELRPHHVFLAECGHTLCIGYRAESVDDKSTRHDEQRHPNRHELEVREDYPQAVFDDAVASDIENRAELGGRIATTRDPSIETVQRYYRRNRR